MKSLLLQNLREEGYVTKTLMSDVLALLMTSFIVVKLVVPFTRYYMRMQRLWRQIGGPERHWLYGHLHKYRFSAEGLKNSLRRSLDYPKMVCNWLGPFYMVLHLHHPDVVQRVLSKSYPKPFGYQVTLGRLLRDGLITSNGSLWKRHRKMLTAVFHFDVIKTHIEIFNDSVHRMNDFFAAGAKSGKPCDVTEAVNSLTYENTMRCVFSKSDIQWEDSSFADLIRKLNFLCMNRLNQPLYFFDAIYNWTPTARKFDSMQLKIYKMLEQIIEERKAIIAEKGGVASANSQNSTKGKKKFVDFLDMLLLSEDEQGQLSEAEIMDEVVTFFAAGQETVANSLSWALYNLAQNPEWQDKCREEIFEIVGDNEYVESQEESRMAVLTMCIKEAMRLYPILHVVGRELTEDVELKGTGVTLEKGNPVNVNIFTLHHNPAVWKDPEVYDPSRFTPENSSKRSPFAFIPFAAGPRNCIGQNFAMHQMRVTLSHVLRKFEFYLDEDCPEPEIMPCVTLQIKDGIYLRVRPVQPH